MGFFQAGVLKAGISLLHIEPKYAITDHIGVGVRYEHFFGNYFNVFSLRSDYTFTTTFVRPSVGLGLGRYALGDFSFGGDDAVDLHTVFGIAPRVQLNIVSSYWGSPTTIPLVILVILVALSAI